MNPWTCAFLIAIAGGVGGIINALLTDNGFPLPRREAGIWCPGAISNVLIGAFAPSPLGHFMAQERLSTWHVKLSAQC